MEQQMESGVNRVPNFLIVGAAKAGTTSLAHYLSKHPDIYLPKEKELRFFTKDVLLKTNPNDPLLKGILNTSVFDENDYFEIFDVPERLKGEASVHYLYHSKESIKNIMKFAGDIPIIIMLRNPVQRAISNFEYLKIFHNDSFDNQLNKEDYYIKNGYNSFWYYKALGLYSEHVNLFLKSFSNVKIIIFEEFAKNTDGEMKKVYDFLKVDPISNNYLVLNKSSRYTIVRKTLNGLGIIRFANFVLPKKLKATIKETLIPVLYSNKKDKYSSRTLMELEKYYREDIAKLEGILKINLSIWK